jgi:phage baseplate assembly protein V
MILTGRGRHGVSHPELTDGERRTAGSIEVGKVHEVDYAKAKVRVMIGDEDDDEGHLVTGWLPMPGARSKNDSDWHPLEVGEGVVVLAPSGELQNGVVLPAGLYTDDDPAPGDKAGLWRRKFQDGGSIEYDRTSGEWLVKGMKKARVEVGQASVEAIEDRVTVTVGGGVITTKDGEITLTAGGVTLKVSGSGVEISGGQVTHDGKNIGKDHKHSGVQAGAAQTGVPV